MERENFQRSQRQLSRQPSQGRGQSLDIDLEPALSGVLNGELTTRKKRRKDFISKFPEFIDIVPPYPGWNWENGNVNSRFSNENINKKLKEFEKNSRRYEALKQYLLQHYQREMQQQTPNLSKQGFLNMSTEEKVKIKDKLLQLDKNNHTSILPISRGLQSQKGVSEEAKLKAFEEDITNGMRIVNSGTNQKLAFIAEQMIAQFLKEIAEEAVAEEKYKQPFSNLSQNNKSAPIQEQDLVGQPPTENQQPDSGRINPFVVADQNISKQLQYNVPIPEIIRIPNNRILAESIEQRVEESKEQFAQDIGQREWESFVSEHQQEMRQAERDAEQARLSMQSQRTAPNQDGADANIKSLATTTQHITAGEQNLGLSQIFADPGYNSFLNGIEEQYQLNESQAQMFESIATDESHLTQNILDMWGERQVHSEIGNSQQSSAEATRNSNTDPSFSLAPHGNISGDQPQYGIQMGPHYLSIKDVYDAISKIGETISKISGDIKSLRLADYKKQTSVFKQKIVTKNEPTDFQISPGALFKMRKCC